MDAITAPNEETLNEEIEKRYVRLQKTLRLLVWSIVPILVITLGLAILLYPEPYEFFKEYISHLGGLSSEHGHDNLISSLIMTIGFGLAGLIALIVSIIYFVKQTLRFNTWKGILALILAVGAAGVGIPLDHPTLGLLHRIGALMFIFGFGIINFVWQLLRFSRKHRPIPPNKTFDLFLDFIIVVIVFVALGMMAAFYILDEVVQIATLRTLGEIMQKVILMVDFTAIFFLDVDDM